LIRYLARRVLYTIPTLIGVSLLTFFLFFVVFSPETLARRNLSAKNPSSQQIATWVHEHGYDKPKAVLFKEHMESLLTFDFGRSDKTKDPILDRIKAGALPSFELGALTFTFSFGVGLGLAIVVAYLRGTYIDAAAMGFAVLFMSVPVVVYVIGVQYFFGKVLRYGPLAGYATGVSGLKFMILPILVAVVSGSGYYVRLYRTFLLDETGQDYVRTARAKGVSESLVLFKHVLKNAMIPVVTTTVASIPSLILGNLVLESFFGIPGLGNYLVGAIGAQDFAVVRAMVYLGTLLYIVGLLVTDILYALLDPRVRLT
jgi:peptide/nickel transport system permease protein